MKASSTLIAKAFIGEIRQVQSETNENEESGKVKCLYFATISIPCGNDKKGNKRYQYLSCYVNSAMNPLFEKAFSSQTKNGDHIVNMLSGQISKVEIEAPFFENNGSYLNGTGILKSIAFQ